LPNLIKDAAQTNKNGHSDGNGRLYQYVNALSYLLYSGTVTQLLERRNNGNGVKVFSGARHGSFGDFVNSYTR